MNRKRTLLAVLAFTALAALVLFTDSNMDRLFPGTGSGSGGGGAVSVNGEEGGALGQRGTESAAGRGGAAGEGLSELPFSPSSVEWRGAAAPCDAASATVYLPCDAAALPAAGEGASDAQAEAFWESVLRDLLPTDPRAGIAMLPDEGLADPAGAVRTGHPFPAQLSSGEGTSFFSIVLTGLPALCLHRTDEDPVVLKEDHEGLIRFVPLREAKSASAGSGTSAEGGTPAGAGSAGEYRCAFHVRGNVSASFAKRPYKVSVKDAAGGKEDVSWAGLRSDDDWILNPLFSDRTRVREMTAYALWEQTASLADVRMPSSRMEYVELFLDDSYEGIYGLQEPVDRKQLGLERGDLLYKIDRWDREDPYIDMYGAAQEDRLTQICNAAGYTCVELRYPKEWDATASWAPMEAFHRYCFYTGDPSTLTQAGLSLDADSFLSLSLFCALTHASDNNWKNTLLAARWTAPGRYTLERTVWDLNYVFGDVFVYDAEALFTVFDMDSAQAYTPYEDSTYDLEALLGSGREGSLRAQAHDGEAAGGVFAEGAPEDLSRGLADKWRSWRQSGIGAEGITALARQYAAALRDSGALARETARWPQAKDSEEALREMEEWIRRRVAFLDAYFGFRAP